ncbi:hypothetical protein [Duganella sp.]
MELIERVDALERQLDDLTARGACTRYPLFDMYDESFDACSSSKNAYGF